MSKYIRSQQNEIDLLKQPLKELRKPPMYEVFLLNDDYTPMDFVVEVLEMFFSMEKSKALATMLQVHYSGKGVCGVFTKDIAETKVTLVDEYASRHEHPLMCNMQPVV